MKKHLLIICLLFCGLCSQATVHTIQVANFQFNPSSVNAVVGDTITWTWVSGSHTTTCDPTVNTATSLPAGATTWNSDINSGSSSFSYKLLVAGTYNFLCIPHQSVMKGVINVSSILPVTLISFNTSVASNNKALLKWTVANETNVSYYSVQKSIDGSTFTEAGRIEATGNTSLQKTYTFTDNATAGSKYTYYSLKIIDKDGKSQLSPITMFTNAIAKNKIIISLSPNPISSPGHLMLQFNADKPGTMLAQLFDMNGKMVKEANMMAVAGVNNGHFHLGELPAGTYTIVFTLDVKKKQNNFSFSNRRMW